jgi:hypothetical protein
MSASKGGGGKGGKGLTQTRFDVDAAPFTGGNSGTSAASSPSPTTSGDKKDESRSTLMTGTLMRLLACAENAVFFV